MSVRAKMRLSHFREQQYLFNNTDVGRSMQQTVARFDCSYDSSIPEDQSFCKATPSGHCEMMIDNPAALAQLEIGKSYYVDFTPAE